MSDKTNTTPLQKIVKGMGYLEGYGHHPGIPIFCVLVVLGFSMSWQAGIATFFVFGAMLCMGAYERAKDYDRGLR